MNRTAVLVTLLLAMLWQSVAMARIGSTVNVLVDPVHAAMHWLGESHHHHDDGSHHAVDSVESSQHMSGDPIGSSTALLMMASDVVALQGSIAPDGAPWADVPNPDPDGLLRPPRSRS